MDVLRTLQPLCLDADDYVFTDQQGKPVDQNEFGRKFTAVLRVLNIRPRRFYNTRHTYISVALTVGCNPKWIAEQTGTSLIMIQQNYGRYIREDGDALLRAYVGASELEQNEKKTETFGETFASASGKHAGYMVIQRESNRVSDVRAGVLTDRGTFAKTFQAIQVSSDKRFFFFTAPSFNLAFPPYSLKF